MVQELPKQPQPSPTIEDYLGVIYTLSRDGERVIAARLSDSLDVSPPTVTRTLQRMQRDGWVSIDDAREIQLTAAGQAAAMSVIRRHMLTEWMLSRMLKLPLAELHREAHQIEHTLSQEVAERLQDEMEDPRFCPHGNPLPGFEAEANGWLPLPQIESGCDVILTRIHETLEEDYHALAFLEKNGLVPGARLMVRDVLLFNETMRVQVNNQDVILGLKLANEIYVESA